MKYSRQGPLGIQSFAKVGIAAGLLYFSFSNMEEMKHREEKSDSLEPICVEPNKLEIICTGIAPLLAGIAIAAFSTTDFILQGTFLLWDSYDMIAGTIDYTHID